MDTMEFDFGPDAGGQQLFSTRIALTNYLGSQVQDWNKAITESILPKDNKFEAYLTQHWAELLILVEKYQPHDSLPDNILLEFNDLLTRKILAKELLSRQSHVGMIFNHILDRIGAIACSGAWQVRLNVSQISTLSNLEFIGGVTYLTALVTGVNGDEIINKTTDQTFEIFQQKQHEFQELANTRLNDQLSHYDRSKKALEKDLQNFQVKAKECFERQEVLESTYREKLRLDAPAKFWADEAARHGKLHGRLGIATVVFAILFVWATWCFGPAAASHANSLVSALVTDLPSLSKTIEGQKFLVTLRLASVGVTAVLLSTLAIWTLRYLVRMMISENHLKSDAKTREVMISTYLALIKESGNTEKEDRHIILSSIFTPPTDGLLKDDGLPIATQLSMLANRPS